MHTYHLDVQVADTPACQEWLRQFEAWLNATPNGVVATMHKRGGPLGDVVWVYEVIEFIRRRGDRTPPYNGRSVFYYLVDELHDRLVVQCTECHHRYGICRCDDRGFEHNGQWCYTGDRRPGSPIGQDWWAVERASLLAFDVSTLPKDPVALRRKRVLAFLRHLKGE